MEHKYKELKKKYSSRTEGVIINDIEILNEKLKEWEKFYNCHRPHSSLNGKMPYKRMRGKLISFSATSDWQIYSGYMMCIGNHIPFNVTPPAVNLYFDLSAEIGYR